MVTDIFKTLKASQSIGNPLQAEFFFFVRLILLNSEKIHRKKKKTLHFVAASHSVALKVKGFVSVKVSDSRSVSGRLSHLPAVGHGPDAAVVLFHRIDHVDKVFPPSNTVSKSSEAVLHILIKTGLKIHIVL